MGLLLVLFRRSERWLHQHIFKVGWLLCNSYQTTTILYYIFFLPGILLHELALWLAASLLNVRAERAIGFPAAQEIGELRLNFIRVSADAPSLRYGLVKLAPLIAGLVALWAISSQVFNWREVAAFALTGDIDDLALAISRLTRTADFWLWFYLAFTIANTMFPSLRRRQSKRRKTGWALAAGALALAAWRLAGEFDEAAARVVESLVGNLALVVLGTLGINLVALLALGGVEALIERVTGKSATFEDDKMIALSRAEAQARKQGRGRGRRRPGGGREANAAAQTVASIYEFKLPIPGPPGREPVSRSAVSVINVKAEPREPPHPASAKATSPGRPLPSAGESARSQPAVKAPAVASSAKPVPREKPDPPAVSRQPPAPIQSSRAENAPFARPFVEGANRKDEEENTDALPRPGADGQFQRPFAMKSRAGVDAAVDVGKPPSPRATSPDDDPREHPAPAQGRKRRSKTKPAPKPSGRASHAADKSPPLETDELSYEPLDDEEVYIADDEA